MNKKIARFRSPYSSQSTGTAVHSYIPTAHPIVRGVNEFSDHHIYIDESSLVKNSINDALGGRHVMSVNFNHTMLTLNNKDKVKVSCSREENSPDQIMNQTKRCNKTFIRNKP